MRSGGLGLPHHLLTILSLSKKKKAYHPEMSISKKKIKTVTPLMRLLKLRAISIDRGRQPTREGSIRA
jgi:hypothetical protein